METKSVCKVGDKQNSDKQGPELPQNSEIFSFGILL